MYKVYKVYKAYEVEKVYEVYKVYEMYKFIKCIKCCSSPIPQTSYLTLVGLIGTDTNNSFSILEEAAPSPTRAKVIVLGFPRVIFMANGMQWKRELANYAGP